MRKQIFALAIFAVLLVAAGAVVSMAQDSYGSNDEPLTSPSEPVIFPTAGGMACLDFATMGNGFEIELTPIGSNTLLIGGEDVCWEYSVPLDGSMVFSDGVFNIGITGYPVAPGTAPAHFSGFINPNNGQGHVWWTNPTLGLIGEDDWQVRSCPCPCLGPLSTGLGSPYE